MLQGIRYQLVDNETRGNCIIHTQINFFSQNMYVDFLRIHGIGMADTINHLTDITTKINPGKVTGWMQFAGMKERVTLSLEGDFHRDIRGARIHFTGDAYEIDPPENAQGFMEGFASEQKGRVGDITAGLPPQDYVKYPYIEWYSEENGRVVIELEQVQVEVIGRPIPTCESDPISREQQNCNMAKFLGGLAAELNLPKERAICVGGSSVVAANKRAANNKIRGMKLQTIRLY